MPEDGQLFGPADIAPGTTPCGSLRDVIEPFAFVALLVIPLLAFFAVLSLPATVTIPAGAGLALSLFIPVLCGLSVLMKHNRSRRRRDSVMQMDQVGATQYFQLHGLQKSPSIIQQTWFPILVIFLFNLYFTYLLVYTPKLSATAFGNFLLLGHLYPMSDQHADDYLRQSFDVMCFAYLGWYVWTVSVIFSRIITMELVAATYYNTLLRLVVAIFVALVFNHIQMLALGSRTPFIAEAVGFGVGLFPDSALISISTRLRHVLLGTDDRLEQFPLDLIQGISPFRALRLFEMGLDNCENLAAANAAELYLASNLKLVEVADWIGQAQLAVLVGSENFMTLQKKGYRTVIDLHRASHSPAAPVLAGLLHYEVSQLVDLADGLEQDPSYRRLTELRRHLCEDVQLGAGPTKPVLAPAQPATAAVQPAMATVPVQG